MCLSDFMHPAIRLQLITHRQNMSIPAYCDFIADVVKAGVTLVQCREKNIAHTQLITFIEALQETLSALSCPLLINDDMHLAGYYDAGVHLGQTDGSPTIARTLLGPEAIIGGSIESLAELDTANRQPYTYVAASAVFPTTHKNNLKTFWGLDGLSILSTQSVHPIVGIGGIDIDNVRAVMSAGAQGVAVIGAIHDARDPVQATKDLRAAIEEFDDANS